MFEVQILIPQWDNDNWAFSQALFDQFEAKALEQFGGYSRQTALLGAWKNSAGRVYQDCSRVYIVACQNLTEGHSARLLAIEAKDIFHQEAIYIRYLGLSETV